MNDETQGTSAQELREAFDRTFAEPREGRAGKLEAFLCLRVADDSYAMRLDDVSSVHTDPAIALVPSSVPELLGVAGSKSSLTAVYDLAALLGYSGRRSPRWLILTRGATSVGLAFDGLEAQVRVPADSVSAGGDATKHSNAVLRIAARLYPVIDLTSLLAAIARRAALDSKPKEY